MAIALKTAAGKFLKNTNGIFLGLIEVSVIARVPVSTGGNFTMANGDIFHIDPMSQDAINFSLMSGMETSAFYEWNGNIQQTGFGTIYDYSDLYDYDGSELRVYESPYELSNQIGSEQEQLYIQYCGEPIIVLRLNAGYWEQIK